ncbi:MAG: hypothetical protein OEQ18_16195 [Gammaproteobacteria bacterium]|nr:hypothetical protein [Gammaproteobacteria bacterium]
MALTSMRVHLLLRFAFVLGTTRHAQHGGRRTAGVLTMDVELGGGSALVRRAPGDRPCCGPDGADAVTD